MLIGGATIAVFLIEKRLGMPVELARTLAVKTLVCGQAFYLFNSRCLRESSLSFIRLVKNRVAWLAVGVLAVLQMVFVYAPFMHRLFGSAPLELRHWLLPLGIGFGMFLLVEAEKAISRPSRKRKTTMPAVHGVTAGSDWQTMKKKNEPSKASRAQKPGSAASRRATAKRRAAQHPARSSAEQKRPPTARSRSTFHQRRRLLRVAAGSVVGGLVAGPVGLAAGVIVGAALPDTPAEVKGRPARKRSQRTPRRRTT